MRSSRRLQAVRGHLAAWDPVTQQEVWRVQHATSWNGGLLSTAGNLLFQGRSDGVFAAYRADTGELVWEYPVGVGIIAAPVTYTVGDEQYVAVLAGWGGAFGLASGAPRHRGQRADRRPRSWLSSSAAQPSYRRWTSRSSTSHSRRRWKPRRSRSPLARPSTTRTAPCVTPPGLTASGGAVPDLRYSDASVHAAWDAIVRGGAFAGRGMASFAHAVDEAGAEAIRAYVVEMTKATIGLCQSEYRKNYPELLDTACTRPEVTAGP